MSERRIPIPRSVVARLVELRHIRELADAEAAGLIAGIAAAKRIHDLKSIVVDDTANVLILPDQPPE